MKRALELKFDGLVYRANVIDSETDRIVDAYQHPSLARVHDWFKKRIGRPTAVHSMGRTEEPEPGVTVWDCAVALLPRDRQEEDD